MQKTKFKFENNEYKIIVQSRHTIGAIRLLDDCCAESCVITDTNKPLLVKSTVEYTLRSMCWLIAERAMLEAEALEKTGDLPVDFTLPDGKKYDALKPTSVPGTSKGIKYSTLVTTHNGLISYFHGKIMDTAPNAKPPRIRVVKTDPTLPWSDTKINDLGAPFGTVENTHMSHTGTTAEHTKKLIARGAYILINVKKDFE